MTNELRDVAHGNTLLIDLTLGEHLLILGERRGVSGYVKSGIFGTEPAISLKRNGLEPKLLQSVYRNPRTAYRLVTNLVTSKLRGQGRV